MRRCLALLALPLVLLAGCDPVAPAPPTSSTPEPSAPVETAAPPAALDADVLLVVTARATADNGAVLDLRMEVHKATAWSDTGAADRPAMMTAGCDGYLDLSVYEANLWSFLAVDVTATADPSAAAWPNGKRIRLWPTFNDDVSLASDGFLVDDPNVDGATPQCRRDRYIYGDGEGRLLAGIQGDTDEVGAAGQFTRWANQRYGFVAREVAGQSAADAGIVLTECTFLVNGDGEEPPGAAYWANTVDESNCYTGSTEG